MKDKIMMKRSIFLLFALIISISVRAAENIQLTASAPSSVVEGTQFRLTYTVNAEGKNLRVPNMSDFDVLYGPSTSRSQSIQFINGESTSSIAITFTYTLLAKKEGVFTIPSATIEVKGKKYTSNPLSINVLASDQVPAQSSDGNQGGAVQQGQTLAENDLFILPIISKTNVYEQECILLTYKLYTTVDIRGFRDVKYPEFQGFFAQEIDQPQDRQYNLENYKGRNYRTVVLKQTLLFPQRSGKLMIDPGVFDIVVRLKTQPSRRRSFFDDYFDSYQDVSKTIHSRKIEINVKPLPPGKPASFANAVGEYAVSSSINNTSLKTNEPVTMKVAINGTGNFKVVKSPEIKFPVDFEVYDPKMENNLKNGENGVTGTRSIEYLAIPRFAGNFTIPSIEWSYFNPKTGKYHTHKTPTYEIAVEKGTVDNETYQSAISDFSNKENVRVLGTDIRYIQTKNIDLKFQDSLLLGSGFYWFLICLIVFASIVVFLYLNRRQRLGKNVAYTRNKKAMKIARKRLKLAENSLKKGDKNNFYEETLKAVWFYLSDKLNIPLANLNKENLLSEMTLYGADTDMANEFITILNDCEFARYAPSGDKNSEMNKMYQHTLDVIEKFENVKKR